MASVSMLMTSITLAFTYASRNVFNCPTWTYPNLTSSQHECVCGDRVNGGVVCNEHTKEVVVTSYYCMSYDEKENMMEVGYCPYKHYNSSQHPISSNPLKVEMCSRYHRKGRLCGECDDNYTLPLYSYDPGCVKCDNGVWYNWFIYIAAAFLPLTVFYIIVLIFRISVTSPTLNGFVLFSQVVATPAILRTIYSNNLQRMQRDISNFGQNAVDIFISIYAVWNLDFMRSYYSSLCVHTRLRTFQVLALDYAVAVYPLLLILITFILVKLHDNFSLVVSLWRPFYKCLFLFRRQFNIRSSLVNALATFIVLSYIKILNVSFDLLRPSTVYNVYGERVNVYLFYDGTVKMTSRDYLPYLLLAIVMLLVFNILPLILLTLYPMQCFQKFLSRCCLSINTKLALQAFMDAFQGCFKESAHDCRYFAALYVALRFVHPLLFIILKFDFYRPIFVTLIVFVLILVVKFQPYKCRRSNMVDTVLLFVMVVGNLAYTEESMIRHHTNNDTYLLFRSIAGAAAITVPPTFCLFLIVTKIHSSDCYKKLTVCISDRIKFTRSEAQAVLVNSNQADYKTF